MAKQSQQQPGEGLSDQQQEALVHIGKMMGPHATGFDARVQAMHDEAHAAEHANTDYEKEFADLPHEASFAKMRAAQTGGASETGLGPTQAEQTLMKQRESLQQQSAAAGAQQAAQAQGQQASVAPPPAPVGPQGTTTPYPAQKGAVGEPGIVQAPPSAPVGPQKPAPAPEEPQEGEET